MQDLNQNDKKTSTINRAFKLMNLLANCPPGLSFSVLKKLMNNLPSPTLSRLLKYLIHEDVVSKNTKGDYIVGQMFENLARKTLNGVSRGEVMAPFVSELADLTNQSAAYAEILDNAFVLRAKSERPDSFHYIDLDQANSFDFIEINQAKKIVIENGFGLICLAHQSEKTIEKVLLQTGREYSEIQLQIIKQDFARLKSQKCHAFVYKNYFQKRIVAPVFCSITKKFVGAIGITIFAQELDDKIRTHYFECVSNIANKASHLLIAK